MKRSPRTAVCAVALAVSLQGVGWAALLPDDATIDWSQAGVPGGIPARPTVHSTLGPSATASQISSALNACPENQVVLLQAGTYQLGSDLFIGNDNVTLRGAGMGKTILRFAGGGQACITVGGSEWPRPAASIAITGGAVKGSTTVTVDSAANVVVGRMIRIEQANLDYVRSLNGGVNNMSFMFLVTGKTANTVTFTPAIPFTLTQSPAMAVYGAILTRGVGIEDLTIEMQESYAACAVMVQQSWGCWLKNVESAHSNARQFMFVWASASTVRGCYTHDIRSSGPNHEGIDMYEDACWNLIEDNICFNGGFPMIQLGDAKGGCSGNVIAYNYCYGQNTGDPTVNGIASSDISVNHGPHNMLNLTEGNIAQAYGSDGYFGSSSHNTVFRNHLYARHPVYVQHVAAIYLHRWSRYFNIIGNVLGDSNFPAAPTGLFTSEQPDMSYMTRLIFHLGYPNMGNNYYNGVNPPSADDGALDLGVKNTLRRHGNYDYSTRSVIWDPAIPERDLPASLYLSAKPAWFGTLPWPSIGPDVSPMVGTIPAKVRYEGGAVPTGSMILLSKSSLSFAGTLGGAAPSAQAVDVTHSYSTNSLPWTLTDNAAWLSVTPVSGTTPRQISASVNTAGLSVGTYTATITLTAPGAVNSPQVLPVTLTIAQPTLGLSPSSLSFSAIQGGATPAAQTVSVANTGTATALSWSQSDNAAWLSVTPASGSTPGSLTVSVNPAGLALGTYSATITVTAAGAANSPQAVPVTLLVSAEPVLTGRFEMTYTSRAALLADGWSYTARTAAGSNRNTEQTAGAVVSYDQSAHPGVLRVPCDEGDLWAGLNDTRNTLFRDLPADWTSVRMKLAAFSFQQNYQQAGIVIYQDDDNYLQIYRTYENGNCIGFVKETDGAAGTLISVPEGATSSVYMRLDRNSGTQAVAAYYSVNGTDWTTMGSTSQSLTSPRLGIVIGASPSGFPSVDLAWVEVYAAAPAGAHLTLSSPALSFSGKAGGTAPGVQTVNISNTGTAAALSWTASDNAGWLQVAPASGTTPGAIQVSVNTTGLSAGTYSGNVTVAAPGADNTPVTLPVTLAVTSIPQIALTPVALSFSVIQGGSVPAAQTVAVANAGTASALSWTQSDNAAWLQVSPASGSTPGSMQVSVNPSGLAVGNYTGSITVSAAGAGNSPQAVSVALTVAAAPTPALGLSPSSVAFTVPAGGVAPPSQAVNVVNTGSGTVLNWTQTDDAAWLQVSPASGTTPGALALTANPTGLAAGTYTARVSVAAATVPNSPQYVTAVLTVTQLPMLAGHFDMRYAGRAELLAAGWDFKAMTAAGVQRDTEQTAGAVVSYDQSAHPNVLRIPCDDGDLWNGLNNTRNSLFRDLPPDWTIVKMKLAAFTPFQNFQQAGVVVYQNDDKYVQIYRTHDNGQYVGFVRETGGTATAVRYLSEVVTTNVFMRLLRAPAAGSITASYSRDNVTWVDLGTVTVTLNNPRVGLVVTASPGGYPNADVDWVEVYSVSVPPEERKASPVRILP